MNKLIVFFALVAAASAAQLASNQEVPIISQSADVRPDGFEYAYETGNGIAAQEQGQLKSLGKDEDAIVVQGAAQWQSPEGENIQLTYIADENGYQPQGSHLPTPPPPQAIPDAILRSIEYIRTHAPKEVRQ